MVTVIQRFGGALNLNIHLHMLVLDGVYTFEGGRPHFHRTRAPDPVQLKRLLDRLIHRILRRLVTDGLLVVDSEQPRLDFQPDETMGNIESASIRYRIAVGPDAGRRTMVIIDPHLVSEVPRSTKPFTAARDGFSLNAAVVCQPHQRQRLERLCRYITRPAVSLKRLSVDAKGHIRYALKHPWSNGTTHLVFGPVDFIARLAALVPRPRRHLTRYHGVLAPNSPYRSMIVPRRKRQGRVGQSVPKDSEGLCLQSMPEPDAVESGYPLAPLTWAQRLKRVFDNDITVCPKCGGRLRVIADVTDPELIRRILAHRAQRGPPV